MRLARSAFALISLVAAGAAQAQVPDDTIFNSGFEPLFRISGKAGYPTPAAGALIEAHAANHTTTTLAGGDGRYTVAIELRHLPGSAVVELVAFDRVNATRAWAGALGPASRLITLGGAAASIDASHDPFVNLGPYSTVVAAALRGYNGFATIADAATFERAARTISPAPALVYGLALVARGDLPLPTGAANTFDAVLSAAPARELAASVADASTASDACTAPAVSAYCTVVLGLPRDPDFVPAASFASGVVHVPYVSYSSTLDWAPLAWRIDGATGSAWYGSLVAQAVNVTNDDATTGTLRLARQDGQPLARVETFDLVSPPGAQIRAFHDITAVRVRATPGPGGALWQANALVSRVSYPDNPEIAPVDELTLFELPYNTTGGPLPASTLASLPNLANGTWLLPLPFDVGEPAPGDLFTTRFGYDVHAFGTSNGTAQRSGLAYTWSSNGTGRITFAYGATNATLDFINQEEPGVWRAVMHMTASGYDLFLSGLVMPADATGWSAASPPSTYQVTINGELCADPYGGLDPFGACDPFGWAFHAGGALDRFDTPGWGTWTYATAPDAGKLRFERSTGSPAYVSQRRGWERVRWAGGNGYILENVSIGTSAANPAPALVFRPTGRLSRISE